MSNEAKSVKFLFTLLSGTQRPDSLVPQGLPSVGHRTEAKRVKLLFTQFPRLPAGFRAFAYFFYRYVIRLGFLDGRAGTAFHVLQGFWYRYLVDTKVAEVERYMREEHCDVVEAIAAVLDIQLVVPSLLFEFHYEY